MYSFPHLFATFPTMTLEDFFAGLCNNLHKRRTESDSWHDKLFPSLCNLYLHPLKPTFKYYPWKLKSWLCSEQILQTDLLRINDHVALSQPNRHNVELILDNFLLHFNSMWLLESALSNRHIFDLRPFRGQKAIEYSKPISDWTTRQSLKKRTTIMDKKACTNYW